MAETKQQRADRIRREDAAAKQAERDAAAKQAESDARARQAEADARAREAEAKASIAQSEAAARQAQEKSKADAEKAARDAAPWDRARSIAFNVGAMGGGALIGHKLASTIEKRHIASTQAANAQLANLASQATKVIPKGKPSAVAIKKMAAIAASADALKLGKRPAALGLTTAAMLLAEGGFARFVLAPGADGATKEVLNSAGTLSAFAATSLVSERLLQNATQKQLPSASAMATIETARRLSGSPAPVSRGAEVASKVANAARSLPKSKAAGLAVLAAGIAGMVMSSRANASESSAKPAGATGAEQFFSAAAGAALAGIATNRFGRVAKGLSAVAGGIAGASNPITVSRAAAAEPSKSGETENPKTAGGDLVDAFFHSGVAAASLSVVRESGSKLVKAGAGAAGVVNAALALGSLTSAAQKMGASQKDVADLATGALSTVATASSAKILLSPAARLAAGVVSKAFVPLTVLSAAVGAYQGAKKDGVRGAIYGAADSLTGGLVSLAARKTGFTDSPALDLMREAAAKTASDMGKAQTIGVAGGGQGPAAGQPSSDGMTEDYYRLQGGKRIHVTGYKTPSGS